MMNDVFADVIDPLAKDWASAVVPFYIPDPDKKSQMRIAGSAIPVIWQERQFLITCKHVVDIITESRAGTSIARINGRSFHLHRMEIPVDPKNDLAAISLNKLLQVNERMVDEPVVKFVSLDPPNGFVPTDTHLMMGYPISKNKRDFRREEFSLHAYSFTMFVSKSKTEPKTQLADYIKYEWVKDQMIDSAGRPVQAPDPYGVSGGPIFRLVGRTLESPPLDIFSPVSHTNYSLELAAIAADWDQPRNEVLGVPKAAVISFLQSLP